MAENGNKDCYIAALEKKLAELSGIEVDQIKKNQVCSYFRINLIYQNIFIIYKCVNNSQKKLIRILIINIYKKNLNFKKNVYIYYFNSV